MLLFILAEVSEESLQTPLHFTPAGHSPHYTWNEWDLRRNAMNIAKSASKGNVAAGVQTTQSRARRDAETQVEREIGTQTAKEAATSTANMMRKKSIVVGLKKSSSTEVEHVLLEDLLAAI